jgi:DNA helicase-2/ATP-dependent DNA helicase PcrA
MRLRPGQDKVAEYRGGRLAVPAVPGAGKTTCLAYLAAELLAEDPKSKILIVTVINSAVSNFKRKISRFLDERGMPPKGYQVKTLHSLAALVLKEKPEYMMINEAFKILEEQQQSRMLRNIIERWLADNHRRWALFIDKDHHNERNENNWRDKLLNKLIPSIIKLIKLRGYTHDELNEIRVRLEGERDSFLRWAFEIMDDYESRKRLDGTVDFEDLTLYSYHLLREDEGIRKRLQQRWTYIFEDEAQDSTPLQEKILDLLSAGRGNLVRVGDTNQGIMQFSGTDPELFRRFCGTHSSQPIEVASRSTREIMDLANHLVDWVRNSYRIEPCRSALEDYKIRGVEPTDPSPNPVEGEYGIHAFCCDGNDEREEIMAAEMAIDHIRSNRNRTIAVLARQNDSLDRIVDRLKRERDIEFDFVGGGPDCFEDFHRVAGILTMLSFLAEPFDGDRLYDALLTLLPGIGDDPDSIREITRGTRTEDLIYPISGELDWSAFSEDVPAGMLPRLQSVLQLIRRLLEMSHIRADELVLQLASELGLQGGERDLANNLCTQVNMLLRQHPEYGLKEVAVHVESFFKVEMRYMAGVLQDVKGYEPRPGEISLSTYHKAKGLEWDTVFLVGLAPDVFMEQPGQKSRSEVWYLAEDYKNPLAMAHAQLKFLVGEKYSGKSRIRWWANINQISEDLRLLYVALTRARRRLFIGSHRCNHWNRALPPSMIFEELKRYMEEKRDEG